MRTAIMRGLLGLTACGLLTTAVAAADSIELKPVFTSDAKVYVEVSDSSEQTLSGDMLPQEMVIESNSVYGVIEEYQASGDGGKIKMTFDRRGMKFAHPMMGSMDYDSDSGAEASDDNSMSLIAAPYIGKTLVAHVSAEGKVTKLEGFDELSEAIEDSAMGDMLYEQTRASINAESMQQELIDWRYNILPNKSVASGETWTREVKSDNPFLGKVVTSYECKLDKIDGKLAHISFSSNTKNQEGETPPANPMGATPELKSLTSTGNVVYNAETGIIATGKVRSKASFAMEFPGQGAMTVAVDGQSNSRSIKLDERAAEKKANKAAAEQAGSDG